MERNSASRSSQEIKNEFDQKIISLEANISNLQSQVRIKDFVPLLSFLFCSLSHRSKAEEKLHFTLMKNILSFISFIAKELVRVLISLITVLIKDQKNAAPLKFQSFSSKFSIVGVMFIKM